MFENSISEATGPFTAIPNYFLDHIAPTLSATELRVMLYIYRHTLGFRKLADAISYDQFLHGVATHDGRRLDHGAKVSRRALVEALAGLEQRELITRCSAGGHAPVTIRLQPKALKPLEATPEPSGETAQAKGQAETLSPEGKSVLRQEVQEGNRPEPEQVQNMHQTKESFKPQKKINRAAVEASNFILAHVPGVTPEEAKKLVSIALRNGRDPAYLRRLVEYVTSNPAIHTPAAALTALIKADQDRTPPPAPAYISPKRPGGTGAARQTIRPYPQSRLATNARGCIDWSKFEPGGKYAFLAGKAGPGC